MKRVESLLVRLLGLSRCPPSGATAQPLPEDRDTTEERQAALRQVADARRRLAALQIESDLDRR